MKLNRIAASAVAAAAAVAIVSGCGVTHHSAAAVTHSVTPNAASLHAASALQAAAESHAVEPYAAKPHPAATPADRSLAWLVSPGGQAQVTLNDATDTLAWDLEVESHSDTVANHLAFEADARVVRTQARMILAHPALLPQHDRAAYERMLHKFVTMANLLQPGASYGTTPQDYAAWYSAMHASNITVW